MEQPILVLNSGSSSVKFAIYDGQEEICAGQVDGLLGKPRFTARTRQGPEEQSLDQPGHGAAVSFLAGWLRNRYGGTQLRAVGHRIVHGGDPPPAPGIVTAELLERLDALVPQMPLHLPHNIAPMRIIAQLMPQVPQVACFDTWFHRTLPRLEQLFAIPRTLIDEGVRRYGFHGLSYEFVTARLCRLAPDLAAGRVIIAHLGSGASMCAVAQGASVATTMGFTGLDGLPMGTRCGAIDPGILLYLLQAKGMTVNEVEDLLYRRSGLLGLSGLSNDMRDLLNSERPEAAEAVDFFTYRICRELGSLGAALGGLDGLVFTGGIGERSGALRRAICRGASWLGISLDEAANDSDHTTISAPDSPVAVLVVPTDENRVIAEHCLALLEEKP